MLQPLMALLLARGARLDAPGGGTGRGPVYSCLANGRPEAAGYLAARGAPLDLEGAAGIGRLDLVAPYFNSDGTLKTSATATQMIDGFTWACEYGRTDVVAFLLEHGVDAERRPAHVRSTDGPGRGGGANGAVVCHATPGGHLSIRAPSVQKTNLTVDQDASLPM